MKKEILKNKLILLGGVVGVCLLVSSGIKKIVQASETPTNSAEAGVQEVQEVQEKNNPQFRIMNGNYQDYKIIVTVDGNMWFTDEEYQEAELLQVLFDTNGTADVKDDEIIKIRNIDKQYEK